MASMYYNTKFFDIRVSKYWSNWVIWAVRRVWRRRCRPKDDDTVLVSIASGPSSALKGMKQNGQWVKMYEHSRKLTSLNSKDVIICIEVEWGRTDHDRVKILIPGHLG